MTCPVCNAQNSALTARCLSCGTMLIPEATRRSEELTRVVNDMDRNLYMGYGGLIGFVLGFACWFGFSQNESEIKTWLVCSVVVGTAAGAIAAARNRNKL